MAALGCGGDGATAPRRVAASLRVVAGGGASDTVLTPLLDAPLVAELRDTLGRPVAGAVVRFDVAPAPALANTPRAGEAAAYVCASLASACGPDAVSTTLEATTGADGRAGAPIRLGTVAGWAKVYVTADIAGTAVRDSATFTVQPGAATQILLSPRDTNVYAGASFTPKAPVGDRWGNARAERAQLYSPSGLVHVGSDGQVYGAQVGLLYAVATYGELRDTLHLVVVPEGRIVAYRAGAPGGGAIVMQNLDGSGYRAIVGTKGVSGAVYPSVSHAADANGSIVYQEEGDGTATSRAMIVDSLGEAKRPVATDPALVASGYPRFSTMSGSINFAGRAADGSVGVWKVKTDGTGAQLYVALPALDPGPISAPMLSGAEDKVSFSADGSALQIVYMSWANPGGSGPYALGVSNQFVRWAGSEYSAAGPGASGIKVVDLYWSTSTVIDPDTQFDGPAEWGPAPWILVHVPDGNRLALVRQNDGLVLPLLWSTGYAQASWVSP